MSLKSILTTSGKISALALMLPCASAFSQTNRVTKATVHEAPHIGVLLEYLAHQYTNDMRTISGRIKWHGRPIMQEIDTNRWCKTERYADGTTHVEPFRPPQSFASMTNGSAWKAKAEKRKAKLTARRAEIAARKSVVPGLKEAQLATFDAKNAESNVTVNVNIGGK